MTQPRANAYLLSSEDTLGRTPRHSEESERAVLGAIMLDGCAFDLVDLQPEDFHVPKHEQLFRAMKTLNAERKPVDPHTLVTALRAKGDAALEAAGGAAYVASLTGVVPTAANAAYYGQPVRELAWLRKAQKALVEGYDDVMGSKDPPAQILDRVEGRVFQACQTGKHNAAGTGMRDVMWRTGQMTLRNPEDNLRYGFWGLDDLTLGLWPGQLIVIAARPSMGKTTFAVNLFRHWITHREKPKHAAFFSLEVTAEEIGSALVSSTTRSVDSYAMRRGPKGRTEQQQGDMEFAIERLASAPGSVHVRGKTVSEIRGICRRLKARGELDAVIVDYLQLTAHDGDSKAPRHQQVAAIATGYKALAIELEVPVLTLAQLNREVESRNDHRPKMSDLRESGAIEQAADVLGLLHRASYYELDPTKRKEIENACTLILAKNRNGRTGDVELFYDPAHAFMADGQR